MLPLACCSQAQLEKVVSLGREDSIPKEPKTAIPSRQEFWRKKHDFDSKFTSWLEGRFRTQNGFQGEMKFTIYLKSLLGHGGVLRKL